MSLLFKSCKSNIVAKNSSTLVNDSAVYTQVELPISTCKNLIGHLLIQCLKGVFLMVEPTPVRYHSTVTLTEAFQTISDAQTTP